MVKRTQVPLQTRHDGFFFLRSLGDLSQRALAPPQHVPLFSCICGRVCIVTAARDVSDQTIWNRGTV
jgi:hypothetical protein